jgi:hypothetical protein
VSQLFWVSCLRLTVNFFYLDKIDIEETRDNTALVEALVDSKVLLVKHQKQLKRWLKNIIEVDGAQTNAALFRLVLS